MNSQITFEEYFLLAKKAFLYECHYNPEVIYKYSLDEFSDNEESEEGDSEFIPENVVECKEFEDDCKTTYATKVHEALMSKQWFKKVDALEMFTNFWSIGRGLHAMPLHNIYVPVTQTIMPKPKTSGYDKTDQIG